VHREGRSGQGLRAVRRPCGNHDGYEVQGRRLRQCSGMLLEHAACVQAASEDTLMP
jgi:hypothetical protein